MKALVLVFSSLIFCGCASTRPCGCRPLPDLPEPKTHHRLVHDSVSFDFTDVEGWDNDWLRVVDSSWDVFLARREYGDTAISFEVSSGEFLERSSCASYDTLMKALLHIQSFVRRANADIGPTVAKYCNGRGGMFYLLIDRGLFTRYGKTEYDYYEGHTFTPGSGKSTRITAASSVDGGEPLDIELQVLQWLANVQIMSTDSSALPAR